MLNQSWLKSITLSSFLDFHDRTSYGPVKVLDIISKILDFGTGHPGPELTSVGVRTRICLLFLTFGQRTEKLQGSPTHAPNIFC